jgi:hypothetical protein
MNLYSIEADTGQVKSIHEYPDGFLFEVSGANYSTTSLGLICDVDHGTQYWVAGSSSMLFVYIGDSQELIAFARD